MWLSDFVFSGILVVMKSFITSLLIISLVGIAVFGLFIMPHHASSDMSSCVAVCLRSFQPVVYSALAVVATVFLLLFTTIAGTMDFHILSARSPIGDSPCAAFRKKFVRWFSLLEHSPTA